VDAAFAGVDTAVDAEAALELDVALDWLERTLPEDWVVGEELTGVLWLFPVGQIIGFPGWIPPEDVCISPPIS